ncbi:hypothetical protein [Streptomyces paromomycinus]|nr:hypothetical protein [Streptomyces paromomycinus]
MLTKALALQPKPGTTVFRTRLGITALILAAPHPSTQVPPLHADVLATAHTDGYAARDALTQPQLRYAMTISQRRTLTDLVRTAGLDAGTVPEPLRSDLLRAATMAQNRLRLCLQRSAVTSLTTPSPVPP